MKIAVTTNSGTLIDEHFGRADTITIYEVGEETDQVISTKRIEGLGSCVCREYDGHREDDLNALFDGLADCRYVLTARIGPHMVRELEARGVTAFELFDEITPSINKIVEYEKKRRQK